MIKDNHRVLDPKIKATDSNCVRKANWLSCVHLVQEEGEGLFPLVKREGSVILKMN